MQTIYNHVIFTTRARDALLRFSLGNIRLKVALVVVVVVVVLFFRARVAVQVVFKSEGRPAIAARVLLLGSVGLKVPVHVQPEFVDVKERLIAQRADFHDFLDVHQLVQLLIYLAVGAFPADLAFELDGGSGGGGGGGRRGGCGEPLPQRRRSHHADTQRRTGCHLFEDVKILICVHGVCVKTSRLTELIKLNWL